MDIPGARVNFTADGHVMMYASQRAESLASLFVYCLVILHTRGFACPST